MSKPLQVPVEDGECELKEDGESAPCRRFGCPTLSARACVCPVDPGPGTDGSFVTVDGRGHFVLP